MKFFITHVYYEKFLQDFYAAHPKLNAASFKLQREALFNQHYGEADAYSRNLIKLGHPAEEQIINADYLQRRWAVEHGFNNGKYWPLAKHLPYVKRYCKGWFMNVLQQQIRESAPDILYTDGIIEDLTFLRDIKRQVKLIVGQLGSEPPARNFLEQYDLILSPVPYLVERFRSWGIKSEYFRLGFDDAILPRLKKQAEQFPTVFVGSFSQFHSERIKFFEELASRVPVDFWGMGVDHLTAESQIKKRHHGQAWGLDMYNIFFNSNIVVNRHVDMAKQYAANLRLYEATGAGAFLITDYKENLAELFVPGREIETYRSVDELVEKINFYQNHEAARNKIALAGQARTLRDHSYAARMRELVGMINKYL